jgi:hypothetical protein
MSERDGAGTQPKGSTKSKRELAWEKLMLRLLSLPPGMYDIALAIDEREGFLLGTIERRGEVERWG